MPIFYQCDRCTACCRWPGEVKLTEGEIRQIAEHLDISESAFIKNYTRLKANRSGLALKDQSDGACTFLKDGNCRIQPVKPRQCREFPNLWNFPNFQEVCHAIPKQVTEEEYAQLIAKSLASTSIKPRT